MPTSFIGQQGLPLGLRNNNPGDFRTGIAWQGMIGSENGFITFANLSWGLRALARDLITNIDKEGINTITLFISKFAPPSQNDTPAYIAAVSRDSGIDPGEVLGTDQDTLHSLMRAIINHELGNGYSADISDADIDNGIALAAGGSLATLPAAAEIAVQNPGVYVAAVTPLQWAGAAAAVLALIYFTTRKN